MYAYRNLVNQTTAAWTTTSTFITGCKNAPRATLWNIEGKICQKYLYEIEKNRDPMYSQINQLQSFKLYNLIIAGC
mgnify:CR=1 FL=1